MFFRASALFVAPLAKDVCLLCPFLMLLVGRMTHRDTWMCFVSSSVMATLAQFLPWKLLEDSELPVNASVQLAEEFGTKRSIMAAGSAGSAPGSHCVNDSSLSCSRC